MWVRLARVCPFPEPGMAVASVQEGDMSEQGPVAGEGRIV